jgi:hypothetical protein
MSISFEVKLLGERYGIKEINDANNQDEISLLHHHMNEYLSKSMSEGIFIGRLLDTAKLMKAEKIYSINVVRLSEFKIIDDNIRINYSISIIIISATMIISSILIQGFFRYFINIRSIYTSYK